MKEDNVNPYEPSNLEGLNLKYECPPTRADFQLSVWKIDSYDAVKSRY
jgi:hypothetical protein